MRRPEWRRCQTSADTCSQWLSKVPKCFSSKWSRPCRLNLWKPPLRSVWAEDIKRSLLASTLLRYSLLIDCNVLYVIKGQPLSLLSTFSDQQCKSLAGIWQGECQLLFIFLHYILPLLLWIKFMDNSLSTNVRRILWSNKDIGKKLGETKVISRMEWTFHGLSRFYGK